jgi:hypothetical protein
LGGFFVAKNFWKKYFQFKKIFNISAFYFLRKEFLILRESAFKFFL